MSRDARRHFRAGFFRHRDWYLFTSSTRHTTAHMSPPPSSLALAPSPSHHAMLNVTECVDPHLVHFGSGKWFMNCSLALVCVIIAAMAAGLTMGLVSLEPHEIERIM